MSGGTGTVTERAIDHLRSEPSSGAGTAPTWPYLSTLPLGSLPTAIGCVRDHAKLILTEWGLAHLTDDAVLIVSELMTNALDASVVLPHRPPITLRLLANETSLVIEAWDYSPYDLEPAEADDDAEHGRGLMVVQALSERWGVEHVSRSRKVVWAQLAISRLSNYRSRSPATAPYTGYAGAPAELQR
jgi:anti-sigma regulatory factor (Ser/Thr protein kinase)